MPIYIYVNIYIYTPFYISSYIYIITYIYIPFNISHIYGVPKIGVPRNQHDVSFSDFPLNKQFSLGIPSFPASRQDPLAEQERLIVASATGGKAKWVSGFW